MLPERTIGAWRAAAAILARSASVRPVVPTTWAMRAWAASAAISTLAAGAEKSTIPSAFSVAGSGSSLIRIPLAPTPASRPASAPSAAAPWRSIAAASVTPGVSAIALISIRPMRPAAPVTINRMSAIALSFDPSPQAG